MTPIFIGVDGGATKTTLVWNSGVGTTIKEKTIGPTNPGTVGWQQSVTRLSTAIQQVAGRSPIAGISLGLAGIETFTDSQDFQRQLARKLKIPTDRIRVVNDIVIGLRAGTSAHRAAGFIAGTGAHAYAHGPRGIHQATGYGPLLGDDGSGYAIGRAALRAVVAAYDGRGPTTKLTSALERLWKAKSLSQLSAQTANASKNEIAAQATVVDALARQGDQVAKTVMTEAAQAGAEALVAAARRAGLTGSFPVVLIGGVFQSQLYRRQFMNVVQKHFPRAETVWLKHSPAVGALQLTYDRRTS